MHDHIPLSEPSTVLTTRGFALYLNLTDSIARRPRVLVVDDEPDTVTLVIDVLESDGYEVVGASSAREAFRTMAAARPDVVLLDIRMPGMDGVAALSKMRTIYPEAPIIMLTASGNVDVVAETLRRGAFDYVAKPFDVAHLRAVVEIAIQVRTDWARTRLGGPRGMAA